MSKQHKPNVVAISRVSTKEQTVTKVKAVAFASTNGYGSSVEDQLKTIYDYAARMGIEIVCEYLCPNNSAMLDEQLHKTEIIDVCQSSEVEQLLVSSPDRLSRDRAKYYNLVTALGHKDIELRFCDLPYSKINDPTSSFAMTLSLLMSEFDNKERATRCNQGIDNAARDGRSTTIPPLGYKRSLQTGVYQPDDNFKTIQSLFKRYAARDVYLSELTTLLEKQGVRNRNGSVVKLHSLRSYLRNPYYAGFVKDSDAKLYEGLHKPMLSEEEFNAIQTLLEAEDSDTQT